jgi:magnesium chelatase family protein
MCPCGYRGDPRRQCNCSPIQIEKYVGKISGPLLDRIDIHLEVASVPFRELSDKNLGTTSAMMREQVVSAREAQKNPFQIRAHDAQRPDDPASNPQTLPA